VDRQGRDHRRAHLGRGLRDRERRRPSQAPAIPFRALLEVDRQALSFQEQVRVRFELLKAGLSL